MKNRLDQILYGLQDKYGNNISGNGRHYMEVNIGKEAEALGYTDVKDQYGAVNAVIPLKAAVSGMKVRIDGRTFVNYVQFESGIAVPKYIVKGTEIPHKEYVAKDSMIRNFA